MNAAVEAMRHQIRLARQAVPRARAAVKAMRTPANLPPTTVLYGTATGDDQVDGLDLPSLASGFVRAGDFAAVAVTGTDRLILGPIGPVDRDTFVAVLANGGAGQVLESAHWAKDRRIVRVAYAVNFTAAGTAGDLALPVPVNFGGNSNNFETVGTGYWYDANTGNHLPITVRRAGSAQSVQFMWAASASPLQGSSLANGDAIRVKFDYEWA